MKVFLKGEPRRIGGIRRYSRDLASCLREEGVLTNTRPADIFHAVQPIMFPEGHRFVVTCLDLAPLNRANWQAANLDSISARVFIRLFRRRVERSFKRAAAIIAISSQTSDEVREMFPSYAFKLRVVNPGIDQRFKPGLKEKHEWLRIGYYRSTGFGLDRVVDILKEKGLRASLFQLTGTKEEDITAYYNSLDYFVDFGPYRGFGYPVVEARACGVPVMTMKSAKVPDEVKRLTIQVEGTEDAAERMASGVSQPYQGVPFTLEKMASETMAVYREVMSR